VKATLGVLALAVGASSAVLGIAVLLRGLVKHDESLLVLGRRFVFGVLVAAIVAAGAMEWALVSHDFSLKYVAENNATGTPLLFSITGLWAALEGSILLWSSCSAATSRTSRCASVIERPIHSSRSRSWSGSSSPSSSSRSCSDRRTRSRRWPSLRPMVAVRTRCSRTTP
jgi:cytochrome c-type biogenesis protein CcmF